MRATALRLSGGSWVGITLAMFWIALLGHEAAHAGVAHFAYSPGDLSAGQVSSSGQLLVVGAGPVFTLAMIVACIISATRWSWGRASAITAVAFGVSRLVLIAPGTLFGNAINDERTIGPLLGVSARLLWTIEALVGAAAVFVVWRANLIAEPSRSVGWIGVGIVIGWLSAFTVGRAVGLPI
jgi:hypothetical protein